MKKIDYFQMRALLYARETNHTAEFKLTELEKLWYCTQKNVKRKLKQFVEDGDVLYYPGKGRGNPSQLVFTHSLQEEIELAVQELIEKDRLEDIIQLLQLPIPKKWISNVSVKIQDLFGMHSSSESTDILRTIITRKITTLDPIHTSINFESYLLQQLGDTLVIYDQEKDIVRPHLAHHWDVDSDFSTWTFHLRKGVRFHNLHLLTSEDIKYTFQRFQAYSSPHHWLVEDIKQINCPSPYIIRFELRRSNPFFSRYLCAPNLVILPKDEPFDENKWIGSGAFQMKKRNDCLFVLQAFDDYFAGRPFIDEIEFYRAPFEASKSFFCDVNGKEIENGHFQKNTSEVGFRFLAFNYHRQSIIHNRLFREALFHLFDIEKMAMDLGRDNLKVASSYFYWKSKSPEKNRSLVKPLLLDSGYQGETLTIYTVGYPNYIKEAEWLKMEAFKEGIHFEIKTYTLEQLYDPEIEKADLIFMGEAASLDYHLSFIGSFLNKSLIFHRFFTEEQIGPINKFIDKIKLETNIEKRNELIEETERFIRDENIFLYLYHPIKNRMFHPMIKDIKFESFGFVDFRKLWLNNN